jgi:hypothetical protein
MMIDCTERMFRYREMARGLWNCWFVSDPWATEFGSIMAYEAALPKLFEGMVLIPTAFEHGAEMRPESMAEATILVRPSVGSTLMINRLPEDNPVKEWSTTQEVDSGEWEFRLVDFFNWSQVGWQDLVLAEVRIQAWAAHPECVGRRALVETAEAKFSIEF